jgi:hypothetical protein
VNMMVLSSCMEEGSSDGLAVLKVEGVCLICFRVFGCNAKYLKLVSGQPLPVAPCTPLATMPLTSPSSVFHTPYFPCTLPMALWTAILLDDTLSRHKLYTKVDW